MEERKKISEIQWFKRFWISIGYSAFFLIAFFLFPHRVDAATMILAPGSGTYKIGQTFSVGVYVSSADQAMNAAQGVISYPTNMLEVTSLSKSGSILNLWVQEPTFSNSNGTVNFEGIVYNPGYTGSSGKVITITFKTKAAGTAAVTFSSGAVLANDGAGTNILTGMGKASYTIGTTPVDEKPPTTPTTPAIPLPIAPKVISPTHPDSTKWYSTNDPQFEWSLTSDITGVSVSTDREVATDPGTKSSGRISTKTFTDTEDGIWYFHIRLQNARGWGPATNMQFNIDTVKPDSFVITELPRTTTTDPVARFIFTASDALSGIEGYEVSIDTGEPIAWKDDGTHLYVAPVLSPGLHVLTAKALDKAGNYIQQSISFEITPGPKVITPIPEVQYIVKEVPTTKESIIFSQDPVILIGALLLFVLVVLLLVLLIVYLWFKFKYMRKHLHESPESIAELEHSLAKIFAVLRGKIEEYALLVEKTRVKKKLAEHELSEDENRILSDFKKYLDSAEDIMKKHFRK